MMTSTLLKNLSIATAGATLLVAAGFDPAQAVSFNFSYVTDNGSTLSGMLEGEVQADGDKVLVTSVTGAAFNGTETATPFVASTKFFVSGAIEDAFVSFSGTFMDLLACTSSQCSDGFLIADANNGVGQVNGFDIVSSGNSFGQLTERYNPARWTLAAKDTDPEAVPEPASMLGLLVVGALGAGSTLKRKSA